MSSSQGTGRGVLYHAEEGVVVQLGRSGGIVDVADLFPDAQGADDVGAVSQRLRHAFPAVRHSLSGFVVLIIETVVFQAEKSAEKGVGGSGSLAGPARGI
jgi:hypothetical protein